MKILGSFSDMSGQEVGHDKNVATSMRTKLKQISHFCETQDMEKYLGVSLRQILQGF